MRIKQKKSIAQQNYEREQRNLKRRIKTAERQGYNPNLEIEELTKRKYSPNVAANRSALKKMQKLTNEMLRRSTNWSSVTIKGKKYTPSEFEQMKEIERDARRLAKLARAEAIRMQKSYAGKEKQAQKRFIEDTEKNEKERAELNKRPADYEKARGRAEAKLDHFLDNMEKGWSSSFQDLHRSLTDDDEINTMKRLERAIEWVFTLGRYTQNEIFAWADDHVSEIVSQILDSDRPVVTVLSITQANAFIEYLKTKWSYKE